MKIENLLTPEEAEKVMRMSRATITRNKQAGAPVHPISTKGRKYLIDPEEFLAWVKANQGEEGRKAVDRVRSIYELKALRKSMCG